ncbi:hypothetical protein ACWCPI_21170, partial [Streptomyces sp. NPDC001920]
TAAAVTEPDAGEATEAKPKARRTRKTVASSAPAADIPAQATQEPAATQAPAPRRRTRKATVAAEPAES